MQSGMNANQTSATAERVILSRTDDDMRAWAKLTLRLAAQAVLDERMGGPSAFFARINAQYVRNVAL